MRAPRAIGVLAIGFVCVIGAAHANPIPKPRRPAGRSQTLPHLQVFVCLVGDDSKWKCVPQKNGNTESFDGAAAGAGHVTADGISCPQNCDAPVLNTDGIELTARAEPYHTFKRWSGCTPKPSRKTVCTATKLEVRAWFAADPLRRR